LESSNFQLSLSLQKYFGCNKHNRHRLKSQAARTFLAAISETWDSFEPYRLTAHAGELARVDAEALAEMCAASGDDYAAAEAEVLAAIRHRTRNRSQDYR
jgi:hypothetical protein